jgi:DNA-binding transcriptional LysR family regulator
LHRTQFGAGAAMTVDATGPAVEALRVLLAFSEQGEGKAVARSLGIDASGVSRRLRQFQKSGLLAKAGPGLTLTERGRQALPAVRELLRQYDQLARWLVERESAPRELSIATGSSGAAYYLPPVLALLKKRRPDWSVRGHVCRGRDRIRGVADGSFDLAVVSHDTDQVQAAAGATGGEGVVEVEHLVDHRLCLLAGRNTPAGVTLGRFLESQAAPLSCLAEFELVGLDARSGLRRQIEQRLRADGRALRFGPDAGGWQAAREYARHGLGVALIPLSMLEPTDRDNCVLRLLPDDCCVRDLLLRRQGEPGEGQAALRQALLEAAQDRGEKVRRRWSGLLPV